MGYNINESLSSMTVDMNIVKKLCKINEYKGEQCLYKKQPKALINETLDNAITEFVFDTYIQDFYDNRQRLLELINNSVAPKSREDIGVVEFRDVIKTVNSAYEDIKISSETILELHGYLHRYSLVRGGKYRTNQINMYDLNQIHEVNSHEAGYISELKIKKEIEELCENYYRLIDSDEVEPLLIIAIFIKDFIRISPFEENNIKMAKILTLLLLNKNNYEVGRYKSLGRIYNEENLSKFSMLFREKRDVELENYNSIRWLDYFLSIVLDAYSGISEKLNVSSNKKETKTSRIEKVINSTLGYFTKDDIKAQCPDIPEPTINRVFNNLRKDGKIEVVAKGRSAKWKKK